MAEAFVDAFVLGGEIHAPLFKAVEEPACFGVQNEDRPLLSILVEVEAHGESLQFLPLGWRHAQAERLFKQRCGAHAVLRKLRSQVLGGLAALEREAVELQSRGDLGPQERNLDLDAADEMQQPFGESTGGIPFLEVAALARDEVSRPTDRRRA